MKDDVGLESFSQAQRDLAAAAFQLANSTYGQTWDRLALDVRFAADGKSWVTVLEVGLPGTATKTLATDNAIDLATIEVNACRQLFREKWSGLVLELASNGECSVRYSYDSNAVDSLDMGKLGVG